VIPSHIEREIVIDAPVDATWRAGTEPDQIGRWFTDTAEIDLRPGAAGTLSWDGRATHEATTASIAVATVEPPRRFAFRWGHPDGGEAREGNSLLVEFTLAPEGERTLFRIVETGLVEIGWPEEQKAKYAAQNREGWGIHLGNLRDHATAHPPAAPR
jgi:uncharacterized protein YndB with AHSA1/START domain